eukprot:CAMPEP_0114553628 /NCGR_PEP_ID=MMETSP0114-20121206/7770_1 /TAXON_ID=31324 /ORGANISM="Goniomonas sp, Strain m" /LENGTH=642 /DNA_ID=CAMNT_0001738605 /DNA_START=37 /DNA_END=1965 /DNA_ORIENTATION=-
MADTSSDAGTSKKPKDPNYLLCTAVYNGKTKKVLEHLDKGANPNVFYPGHEYLGNALHIACDRGHVDIIYLFISPALGKRAADLSLKRSDGKTAEDVVRDKWSADEQKLNDLIAALHPPVGQIGINDLCREVQKKNFRRVKQFIHDCHLHPNDWDGNGWTPLCYACSNNDLEMIRLLIHSGADTELATEKTKLTPLMIALDHPHGTEMVRYLLAAGANAHIQNLDGEDGFVIAERHKNETMKYWLRRAIDRPNPPVTEEVEKIREKLGLSRLREVELAIIGQRVAQRLVPQAVKTRKYCPEGKPLVLLFSGPPGCGKTLLAERLSEAIATKDAYLCIDCEQYQNTNAMFGADAGFEGNQRQTALTSHLSKFDGQPCVVVLDEFDKTSATVLTRFLKILEKGRYRDPVSDHQVDCTQTIFIATTNIGMEEIMTYFREKSKAKELDFDTNSELMRLQFELDTKAKNALRSALKGRGCGALVRRFDYVIPFTPFTEEECEVLADTEIRDFCNELRAPADPDRKPEPKFVGGVKDVKYTIDVNRYFAKRYDIEDGVASIKGAIRSLTKMPVALLLDSNRLPPGCTLHMSARGGIITVDSDAPVVDEKAARESVVPSDPRKYPKQPAGGDLANIPAGASAAAPPADK